MRMRIYFNPFLRFLFCIAVVSSFLFFIPWCWDNTSQRTSLEMIIDQFSLWASFNLNFLPFQVINLRVLNLREYCRSLERMLSGFMHINKKRIKWNEIFVFSRCQTFAVVNLVFFVWRICWVFLLGRRDNSYKNHFICNSSENGQNRFQFFILWSMVIFVLNIPSATKKAHPSIFLTKFPFRWHFRNEFNDGVISNFLIYLPWEFNSQNRLLFSIANDVFKMMRTKTKLEIIAKSRKYQRLIL